MKRVALVFIAVAIVASVVTAKAQTSTPTNEPPAKLIVDSPVPDLLAQGLVWIPWRVENVQIGPVFGKDALNDLRELDTCTYTWTTCLGCGQTLVLTQSMWLFYRPASTRSGSNW